MEVDDAEEEEDEQKCGALVRGALVRQSRTPFAALPLQHGRPPVGVGGGLLGGAAPTPNRPTPIKLLAPTPSKESAGGQKYCADDLYSSSSDDDLDFGWVGGGRLED